MLWQSLMWPAFCACLAWASGQLLPAIRRTPPGAEAKAQDHALHGWLTIAYCLPLVLLPATWPAMFWSRLLLFDPVLNLSEGARVFRVGYTARFDRGIRWAAALLNFSPEHVRAGVWALSFALCGAWYYFVTVL